MPDREHDDDGRNPRNVTEADDRREVGCLRAMEQRTEAGHDQADDEKQFDFEGHDRILH